MLTKLGSRALNALGYSNNDESATKHEMELDDSKVISGDWVFVREKRPQRSCTKRNSSEKEEWLTVTRRRNKMKPDSEYINLEYDTMDDLLPSEESMNTKKTKKQGETNDFVENENNSVGTILTRNQKRLMMAAEESKMMLERGTKPKRLQNTSGGRIQIKHQNKVVTQADSNKRRGRKRHMISSRYSGKGGKRGS